MKQQTPVETLTEPLAQLERDAEQPLVPGDEAQWRDQVVGDIDKVARRMRERHREHERVLADIMKEDIELAARVKNLTATDSALHADLPRLRERVASVGGNGAARPETERALADAREAVTHWVTRCRQFEQELTTWYTEAYYRDRGTGD